MHWILYNIPPTATGLPEGVAGRALPGGALEGTNDWQRTAYGGPCPTVGRHRYFHKLYALDTVLPDLGRLSKAVLEKAMKGHVLTHTELLGTYQKRSAASHAPRTSMLGHRVLRRLPASINGAVRPERGPVGDSR